MARNDGNSEFRTIVIGLGGLGSAAAYWLSRRGGADVLGLEQFELGHARGESEDRSRIIRLTYHTEAYVRYAQASYKTWEALEEDAEEQVVVKCGEVNFWPEKTTLDEDAFNRSMSACGVSFERLDDVQAAKRFPQFRITDGAHAIYQPDGGFVLADRANAAHRRLAQRNGARLMGNMPVTAIRHKGGAYRVSAGGREFDCEELVIAAGPWTNRVLAHLGHQIPLRVTQEQVTYFQSPPLEAFSHRAMPVWIWMILDNFYGFPAYGDMGVKVAKDRFFPTDPDTRSFTPDPGNAEEVRAFVKKHIPGALGPVQLAKTCLLTHTPDSDFVLGQLPGHPNCVCTVGANHAFKFASIVGRTLTQLLRDGATPHDISAFAMERERLSMTREVVFDIDGFGENKNGAAAATG